MLRDWRCRAATAARMLDHAHGWKGIDASCSVGLWQHAMPKRLKDTPGPQRAAAGDQGPGRLGFASQGARQTAARGPLRSGQTSEPAMGPHAGTNGYAAVRKEEFSAPISAPALSIHPT